MCVVVPQIGNCLPTNCPFQEPPKETTVEIPFKIGYDALPADTAPAEVGSISPGNGGQIFVGDTIRIIFSEKMDPNAVEFAAGNMASQASADYSWSRTNVFNDTLTIRPAGQWNRNYMASLQVRVKDESGNAGAVNLYYKIRDLSYEDTAARNSIAAKEFALGCGWNYEPHKGAIMRVDQTAYFLRDYAEISCTALPVGDGRLYYHPLLNESYAVYGSILDFYLAIGSHNSEVGYPVSDEYACGGLDRCSNFEYKLIRWDIIHGARIEAYPQ